jgi:ABC-type multidrug transport system ATPase subunit
MIYILMNNIVNRLFNYEKDDNYERLILLTVNKITQESLRFSETFPANIERLIFNFIGSVGEIKLAKLLIEKDKQFFKKYIFSDFKEFKNKLFKKINEDSKKNYEYIFKNYFDNFLELWFVYNNILTDLMILFQNIIEFNLSSYLYKFDYTLYDKIILNIYISIILIQWFLFIRKRVSRENHEYLKYKNLFYTELNEVFNSFNIINEMDNFEYHSKQILEVIDSLTDEIYGMCSIGVYDVSVREQFIFDRFLNFIFLSITTYNPVLASQLSSELVSLLKTILDKVIVLEKKIIDNSLYEEILQEAICEEVYENLYIENSEILFKINNLSHSFCNNILFDNVNITIPKNKWIYFYGKSGYGKSTLCKFLLNLSKFDKGDIVYMDKYNDYSYNNLKKSISYVYLNADLFINSSILFNLTYALNNIDNDIYNLINYYMKLFKLDKYINNLDESIRSLSSGEKQRIKIIRLIIHDKPIWILDEPTSNIDAELEIIIIKELKRIQEEKKKSVIFICHNPDIIKYADLIMKIKDNKINIEKVNIL